MAQVTLRFYGRYVLAEERHQGKPTNKVTFLAPRMECGNPPASPHQALMTIPRDAVSPHPAQTTLAPSSRVMTDGDPERSEYFIWNLTGYTVRPAIGGGLRLSFSEVVEDLQELESQKGRQSVLDKTKLIPSQTGPVRSAIEVAGGVGIARAAFSNLCDFIPEDDASDHNLTNDTTINRAREQADLVEIVVPLESGLLRFDFLNGTSVDGVVSVQVEEEENVTVSFSNLCSALPRDQRYDFEFGKYYDLLKATGKNRLIPVMLHGGMGGDCDKMARISYDD